ncbi:hypothetical protein C8T65DRAFT_60026 [Cerioporus squamosus]|nr:hypothetical protein C8T65DRAFT_60026 [Cerioporus squamosus]
MSAGPSRSPRPPPPATLYKPSPLRHARPQLSLVVRSRHLSEALLTIGPGTTLCLSVPPALASVAVARDSVTRSTTSAMTSSSERPTTPSTLTFTSGGVVEESHFTPKLMVALVGSLVGFFLILLGFWVVSRNTCCARSGGRLPQYNRTSVARRGSPIADLANRSRCRLCPFSRRKAHEGESRARAALPTPPPPPPPYVRALSPPAFRASSGSPSMSRLLGSGSTAARAGYSGPPATPDFPPPAYISLAPRPPPASLSRGR